MLYVNPSDSAVKNLPAVQETWVQSLGQEDPLEEGMATHSSILVKRIPLDWGAWQAVVHGVTKGQTWLKQLSTNTTIYISIFKKKKDKVFL